MFGTNYKASILDYHSQILTKCLCMKPEWQDSKECMCRI